MRGLIRFAKTGAVSQDLKDRLRRQARSANHPNRPRQQTPAVRRRRGRIDLGRIGPDLGAVCDQIDEADAMLADFRARVLDGEQGPAPGTRSGASDHPRAMARLDPLSQTVTFILDVPTANAASTP